MSPPPNGPDRDADGPADDDRGDANAGGPADDDAPAARGTDFAARHPRLEVLKESPENAQAADRAVLDQLLTGRGEHYVRNHYPTPYFEADDWTVALTGMVEEETELSLEALREAYPTETVAHTMECSGNGRAAFEPEAEGDQWTYGAVGTALWTGTPLDAVLDDHGAADGDDLWVSVMGADAPEGEEVFTRSVPLRKVREDCLLAYEMNGERLPPDHGYPVRLLVPGWFGNNSVKWVDRVHVMDSMVHGEAWEGYTKYQQSSYRFRFDDEEPADEPTVSETDTYDQLQSEEVRNAYLFNQLPKALVTHPDEGETVDPGPDGTVEVRGAAWAGEDAVELVELSTDEGEHWEDVELFAPSLGRYAWRRFSYEWAPDPGTHTLTVRAADDRGRRQPATVAHADAGLTEITDEFPWNVKGYGNNASEPFGVTVTVE